MQPLARLRLARIRLPPRTTHDQTRKTQNVSDVRVDSGSSSKRPRNASAVSDAPRSRRMGSSGKSCGARLIQPFEGSLSWGRRLCKFNGVGVYEKGFGD